MRARDAAARRPERCRVDGDVALAMKELAA